MSKKMKLEISGDDADVAYLSLPRHPGDGTPGAASKTVRLRDLLQYTGPDINLDLDDKGTLIGIEILA